MTKFPLLLLAQHWALKLKVALWVTEPLHSKWNAAPDAELNFLLSCHLKSNNDLFRCHLHRVCLPSKTFCDLDCSVTTTEIPISQKWHIQATGGWTQGQLQVWGPRGWYVKDFSYQQSWDTNSFQIRRRKDVQCIFWLSHALFPGKSASPVQLNLEKRNMMFSFQINC